MYISLVSKGSTIGPSIVVKYGPTFCHKGFVAEQFGQNLWTKNTIAQDILVGEGGGDKCNTKGLKMWHNNKTLGIKMGPDQAFNL